MNDVHIKKISSELKLRESQVRAVASLLESGGTVPFIARYRKEATDSLDEVNITIIRDRLQQLPTWPCWKTCICLTGPKNEPGP